MRKWWKFTSDTSNHSRECLRSAVGLWMLDEFTAHWMLLDILSFVRRPKLATLRRSSWTLTCPQLATSRPPSTWRKFGIEERRSRRGTCILRNEIRELGSSKGWLAAFRTARLDSLAVGDGSSQSFWSAWTEGCTTRRGAEVWSEGSSICMGDGGDKCDCRWFLTRMGGTDGMDDDKWVQTVASSVDESTPEVLSLESTKF